MSSNLPEFLVGTDPTNTDSDGDGLADGTEYAPGTYSKLDGDDDGLLDDADTDTDTLGDGDDMHIFHADPKSKDTDGDALPDDWEVEHRLDPLAGNQNVDTDEDGVSDLQEFIGQTNPNVPNEYFNANGRMLDIPVITLKVIGATHWEDLPRDVFKPHP